MKININKQLFLRLFLTIILQITSTWKILVMVKNVNLRAVFY